MKNARLPILLLSALLLILAPACSTIPWSNPKSDIDDGEPFGYPWGTPFDEIDTNADGFLDQNEWNQWGGYYPDGGTVVFDNVDRDNDRMINQMEYEKAQKEHMGEGK